MAAANGELGRNNAFNENDEKWYCSCNTHCKRGSYIIGIVWCVFGGLTLLTSLQSPQNVLGAIVTIICGVLTLMAVKDERPGLLLPVLVLIVISIVLTILLAFVLIITSVIAVTAGSSVDRDIRMRHPQMQHESAMPVAAAGSIMIVASIFMFVNAIIDIWFYRVLSKFRRFLIEKQASAPAAVTTTYVMQQPPMYVQPSAPPFEYSQLTKQDIQAQK